MHITYTLDTINDAAAQVLAFAKPACRTDRANTLLFNAPMGAGKTTLITALCKALGVTDPISSPTFSIVNEYQGATHEVLHADLYRLNSTEELLHMGFEDYLHRPATFLFIEWPDLAMPYLDHYHMLEINIIDPTTRTLTIK